MNLVFTCLVCQIRNAQQSSKVTKSVSDALRNKTEFVEPVSNSRILTRTRSKFREVSNRIEMWKTQDVLLFELRYKFLHTKTTVPISDSRSVSDIQINQKLAETFPRRLENCYSTHTHRNIFHHPPSITEDKEKLKCTANTSQFPSYFV